MNDITRVHPRLRELAAQWQRECSAQRIGVAISETLRTVQEQGVRLVGLSALMTTTLPAMEKTIRLLHTMEEPPVIFVGGAVVTPEYAKQMNADYYAKDAHQSVEITRKVMG